MKVVLCDIDNTILWNHKRKQFCARKVGFEVSLKTVREQYSIMGLMSRKQKERFARLFFSNKYLSIDEPRKGAARVLNQLAKSHIIAYYTARHHNPKKPSESMRSGTLKWLKRHGFPYPDGKRTFLFMKPKANPDPKDDLKFKKRAIEKVKQLGEPFIAIDDMPSDAAIYKKIGFIPIVIKAPHIHSARGFLYAKNWAEIEKILLKG